MIRKLLSTLTFCAFGLFSFGQVGTIAPDFTIVDMDGTTHHLQSYLNDGKVVVLDASATWCPPCWSLHQSGALKDVYNTYGYGPNGTNEVIVIFYEADPATGLADLQGTTSGTMGDWLTGTPYPVVDETTLSLNGADYWPQGFPTVSLIRPSDAMIIEDMWNWDFAQMDAAISGLLAQVSVPEIDQLSNVNMYPNPATDQVNIDLGSDASNVQSIEILDATGRIVRTSTVQQSGLITIDIKDLSNGTYMVNFVAENNVIGTRKLMK